MRSPDSRQTRRHLLERHHARFGFRQPTRNRMQTVTDSIRRNGSGDGDSIGVAIRDNQVTLPVGQLRLENLGRDEVKSRRPVDGNLAGRLLESEADIRRRGSFLNDLVSTSVRNDELSAEIEKVWLERAAGKGEQDNSRRRSTGRGEGRDWQVWIEASGCNDLIHFIVAVVSVA